MLMQERLAFSTALVEHRRQRRKRKRKKRLRPSNDHRLLASSFHDNCPLRHCRSFKVIPEAILRGEKKYNLIYTYMISSLIFSSCSSPPQPTKKTNPNHNKKPKEKGTKQKKNHNQLENFGVAEDQLTAGTFYTLCTTYSPTLL